MLLNLNFVNIFVIINVINLIHTSFPGASSVLIHITLGKKSIFLKVLSERIIQLTATLR